MLLVLCLLVLGDELSTGPYPLSPPLQAEWSSYLSSGGVPYVGNTSIHPPGTLDDSSSSCGSLLKRLDTLPERPHACTYCPKRFWEKHHLQAHTRLHTGEKPYACGFCSERFVQSGHLKRHKLKIHPEQMGVSALVNPLWRRSD